MVFGTRFLIVYGIVAAILLGIGMAFDVTALIILGGIVIVGAVGFGVVEKMRSGAVVPAQCPECGGLVSPNAPYCKHCSAPLRASSR
jgi:hypothetical protein